MRFVAKKEKEKKTKKQKKSGCQPATGSASV
jgi:hypothetical protein